MNNLGLRAAGSVIQHEHASTSARKAKVIAFTSESAPYVDTNWKTSKHSRHRTRAADLCAGTRFIRHSAAAMSRVLNNGSFSGSRFLQAVNNSLSCFCFRDALDIVLGVAVTKNSAPSDDVRRFVARAYRRILEVLLVDQDYYPKIVAHYVYRFGKDVSLERECTNTASRFNVWLLTSLDFSPSSLASERPTPKRAEQQRKCIRELLSQLRADPLLEQRWNWARWLLFLRLFRYFFYSPLDSRTLLLLLYAALRAQKASRIVGLLFCSLLLSVNVEHNDGAHVTAFPILRASDQQQDLLGLLWMQLFRYCVASSPSTSVINALDLSYSGFTSSGVRAECFHVATLFTLKDVIKFISNGLPGGFTGALSASRVDHRRRDVLASECLGSFTHPLYVALTLRQFGLYNVRGSFALYSQAMSVLQSNQGCAFLLFR